MSRPTIYTEEIAQAICEAISMGVPEEFASSSAGVSYSTLKRWKKDNEQFRTAIKKAKAEALSARIKRIEKAAIGGEELQRTTKTVTRKDGSVEQTVTVKLASPQWQADAWWLERQFCEEFGLNRVDVVEFRRQLKQLSDEIKLVSKRRKS